MGKRKFSENVEQLKKDPKFKDVDFRIDMASEAPNKFVEEEDFIYKIEDGSLTKRYTSISYKTDLLRNLKNFDIIRLYCPQSSLMEEIMASINSLPWK